MKVLLDLSPDIKQVDHGLSRVNKITFIDINYTCNVWIIIIQCCQTNVAHLSSTVLVDKLRSVVAQLEEPWCSSSTGPGSSSSSDVLSTGTWWKLEYDPQDIYNSWTTNQIHWQHMIFSKVKTEHLDVYLLSAVQLVNCWMSWKVKTRKTRQYLQLIFCHSFQGLLQIQQNLKSSVPSSMTWYYHMCHTWTWLGLKSVSTKSHLKWPNHAWCQFSSTVYFFPQICGEYMKSCMLMIKTVKTLCRVLLYIVVTLNASQNGNLLCLIHHTSDEIRVLFF